MSAGASTIPHLGRGVEIEGFMAQHRTRRPTAKEGEQITPEQLRAAQEWLEEAFRAEPSSPLLPQLIGHTAPVSLSAVVEALSTMATPEAATLLAQIAAKTDAKEIQKAARRALYLARRRPFSGLVFVSLIINDQRGVLDCNAFPVTKKELSRIVTDIQADDRLTHVELPPAYAQQLVEESYRRNLSSGTPVPRDFQGLRDLIGMPNGLWEQRPIYHLVPPEEVRGQPAWLSLSGQLLEVKEFQGWHLPPEALQRYREEVKRTAESPIIVSQAIQQERVEAVQKRTLRELFAPNLCELYRVRLEEMAYLLWQTKRPDDAKRALASALALQGEEVDPAEQPFLRALFTRSVEVAEALEQQDTGRVTVATPRLWTP